MKFIDDYYVAWKAANPDNAHCPQILVESRGLYRFEHTAPTFTRQEIIESTRRWQDLAKPRLQYVNHSYTGFWTWDGEQLFAQNHPHRYDAEVRWPNGERETLEFIIDTRYEGHSDDAYQEGFLIIDHKGKRGLFELMAHQPGDWGLVKNLTVVKYA